MAHRPIAQIFLRQLMSNFFYSGASASLCSVETDLNMSNEVFESIDEDDGGNQVIFFRKK